MRSRGRSAGQRAWGLLENNTNQTAASSAASIVGAGLVAPIPALTMMTGQTLGWTQLVLWTLSISLVGVLVAVGPPDKMGANDLAILEDSMVTTRDGRRVAVAESAGTGVDIAG